MHRAPLSLFLMSACLSGAHASEEVAGTAQVAPDPKQQTLTVPSGVVPDSSHMGTWNHANTSPVHGDEAALKDPPVELIATLSQSGGMIEQTTLTTVYADGRVVVAITSPVRGDSNKSVRSQRSVLATKDQIESLRQALVDEEWHKATPSQPNVIVSDSSIQTVEAGGQHITVNDESTASAPTRAVLSLMRQLSLSALAGSQR